MRIFLTGGTGFIGRRVAQRLRERGDDVVVLARTPSKAQPLRAAGCEIVEGDLSSDAAIRRGTAGADAVIHAGADYRVGVPRSQAAELHEANVRGTERVLDAAAGAGVGRIVYVSTGNVFGNTRGRVADESYRRDPADGFLSAYDESKYRAHEVALDRIARGAPVVIVQPVAVYGPGDTSQVANMIDQTRTGRMKLFMFPELTLDYVHVDDLAEGIVLALDAGRVGEAYILGGERATMRDLVTTVAELCGRRPPRATFPAVLLRAAAPLGPLVGPLLGFPPNLGELIRTTDGVTILTRDEKARRELGYRTRPLREGLRETLAGEA